MITSAQTKKYRTGFVVGKFAPLHKGHQKVIETALANCEFVFVLSYTSEKFQKCDAETREQWLKFIYAAEIESGKLNVHVVNPRLDLTMPKDDDNPILHREYCKRKCMEHFDYEINAVFGSEEYIRPLAEALGDKTEWFLVDLNRHEYPISGTQLRKMSKKDKISFDQYVHPFVAGTFISRVLFLGGESTGKSTLARACADNLNGAFVHEYGRELWEQTNGHLQFAHMEQIAARQHQLEVATSKWQGYIDFVFCDTSALTTWWYSKEMFGLASPKLTSQAFNGVKDSYDYVFLCDTDIPFDQDGTRKDAEFRNRGNTFYINTLTMLKIPFTIVKGSVEERIKQVEKVLYGDKKT